MLKKSRFYFIVFIAVILLTGLVVVQVYWVNNAYQLKQAALQEKVNNVLDNVTQYAEDISFSFYMYGRSYINPGEGMMIVKADEKTGQVTDTVNMYNLFVYPTHPEDSCFYSATAMYYDRLTIADVSVRFEYRRPAEEATGNEKNNALKTVTHETLRQALNDTIPIVKRLKLNKVDSLLTVLLKQEQVEDKYIFGLRRAAADSFEYVSDTGMEELLAASPYSATLFSDIAYAQHYELVLYLYNPDKKVSRSLVGALSVSALIILLLIASFAYFIYTVLHQRRLSEMKTSFINNMTHEFMTPVTNISLAVESLEKEHDKKLLEVIKAENGHIKDNINKVLQVATLEKDSFLLDLQEIDIHQVLKRVMSSFAVQLREHDANVVFDLKANNTIVYADETHIINMFGNIIDNALKYSDKGVALRLSTINEKGMLLVEIADDGIGMDERTQKMIFEKFYRAQKGNIHDVKGFGLGLTYVKSVAEAHSIGISVKSKSGSGTTFIFKFKLRS